MLQVCTRVTHFALVLQKSGTPFSANQNWVIFVVYIIRRVKYIFHFTVACRGFNSAHQLLWTTCCTTEGFTSKQINTNHFTDPGLKTYITRFVQEKWQSNTPSWPSMHGNFIQYWVNKIPVQFSLNINPYWNLNPSFLTLNIKLLGHLVFMGAIQCSAKWVYPPKDFRYHLLTKNHHQ